MASSSKIWKTSGSQPNNRRVKAILDENVWSLLPHELLEKIIAKLPLKFLFQSLTLSRAWSSKLGSEAFQREVLRFSSGWESYCPVLYDSDTSKLVGYGAVSKIWHLLPTHPLPYSASHWELKCSCGSRLVWTSSTNKHGSQHMIYVSNPLNGSGKKLPAPTIEVKFSLAVHAISQGSESFKVIRIAGFDDPSVAYVQIFDSASNSWTESKHILSFLFSGSNTSIYFAGNIYMIGEESSFLVSYNLDKDLWTQSEGLLGESLEYGETLESSYLVLVNKSDVMLASVHKVMKSMEEVIDAYITVHMVDLKSGLAVLVSKSSPQVSLTDGDYFLLEGPIGQGDCIYICCTTMCFRSVHVVYNVSTDKWAMLSWEFPELWTSAKYEPGLNPFLEL